MRGIRFGMGIFVGLIMMFVALGTAAWAQNFGGSSEWFRVSWEPRAYGVRPSIEGYVYNASLYWLTNVRLRVEGLDAERRPVGEHYAWTIGNIGPSDRGYFVAESVRGAATYRITVTSYDVVSRGGP